MLVNTQHSPPSARHGVARWLAAGGAILGLGVAGGALAVGTEAGTDIVNQASATYTDAAGVPRSADSNEAFITVAEIYSATIESDNDIFGAPGQTVNFPHILTNTGNGTDTYVLTLAQDNTDEPGGGGTCQSISIVLDENGDGEADSGEPILASGVAGPITTGPISLDANSTTGGDTADIVVTCQIPSSVAPGTDLGLTLTAEASQDGGNTPDGDASNDVNAGVANTPTVDDITAGDGDDAADGTNEDTVTVSDAAVLETTKVGTYNDNGTPNDLSDDTVTYEIVVRNTGIGTAYNVEISDALDALYAGSVTSVADITINSTEGVFTDDAGDPAEGANADWTAGTLVEVDAAVGAAAPGGVAGATPIATADANGDGVADDFGIRGHDDVLAAGTEVKVIFTVPVDPTLPADTDIPNTVTVTADSNDDGDAADAGETVTADDDVTVPQVYAVDIVDTGAGTESPGVNDGGDDDATDDDIQTVDVVPAGAQVLFSNIVTNNGSGEDTFELTIPAAGTPGNTFPAGTTFSFANGANTGLLTNTNGVGTRDTGPLDPGETFPITIRAKLPANFSGVGPFDAIITARSAGATAAGITPAVTDTKTERLLEIAAPAVDLANNVADGDPAADADEYVQGTNAPVTTVEGDPGDTVSFTLQVTNDSGNEDSFSLIAGGSFDDDPLGALGALPAGWDVEFFVGGAGPRTSTGAIPAGGTVEVEARVSIPSDLTQARADLDLTTSLDIDDVDGDSDQTTDVVANDLFSGNADGDNDYAIFFLAQSTLTGAFDIKMDAVDVNDVELVTLTTDNTGQTQPGNTIDYAHVLTNAGNTVETITLATADDQAGWGSGVVLDTNNDGDPDALANPGVLQATITDADGNLVLRDVTINADGDVTITLNPGESLAFDDRVFAPAGAAEGVVNTTSVTAEYDLAGVTDTLLNEDVTTVVLGRLTLRKFASADLDCDNTADDPWAITATTEVPPGACGCWLVVGENQGDAPITDVVINDAAPALTTLVAGSSTTCAGNAGPEPGGTVCTLADPGDYTATETAPNISWDVGTLASGATASVSFCVELD